jgi:hypothetical protein
MSNTATEESLLRENAYLRQRNAQLQEEDVMAIAAEAEPEADRRAASRPRRGSGGGPLSGGVSGDGDVRTAEGCESK